MISSKPPINVPKPPINAPVSLPVLSFSGYLVLHPIIDIEINCYN